jgi:hypothetical protein
VDEGAGDETWGDAADGAGLGHAGGAGTAGDGALTWQQQTLMTRTCTGCEAAAPPEEGEVDEADGKWYCLGCWGDNSVAAVSPEEALAFVKSILKGSHPQGEESQIMWREFLVEKRLGTNSAIEFERAIRQLNSAIEFGTLASPLLDPQRCD